MRQAEWPIGVLLFIGCALLFAWVSVRPEFNGLLSDSYVYLAAAEALSPGAGHNPALLRHLLEAYPFPPLFPALLGLLGGGSSAPAASYAIGALLLAAACVAFRHWLRRAGAPRLAATLACVAFACLPLTLQVAMGVLSEPLFMLLIFGTASLLCAQPVTARRWLQAATLVALATLTRSVGVAAAGALLLCWVSARGWRVSWSAPLVAVVPPAAWALFRHLGGYDDYALASVAGRGPWQLLRINADAWRQYAVQAVDLALRPHTVIVLTAFGVVAALVFALRLLQGRFDAWYCAGYLAILMLWPHPHHAARFFFVVAPFALAYVLLGVCALTARRRTTPRAVAAVVPVLLLLLALPSTATMLTGLWQHRAEPMVTAMRGPAWYQSRRSQAAISMDFARRLAAFQAAHLPLVPAGACVASIVPQQVLVYGPRSGIDLTQIEARGQTLAQALSRCPYVLMVAARPYPPLKGIGALYPFEHIRAQMDVLAFERDRPDDPDSPLIVMLAKVQ